MCVRESKSMIKNETAFSAGSSERGMSYLYPDKIENTMPSGKKKKIYISIPFIYKTNLPVGKKWLKCILICFCLRKVHKAMQCWQSQTLVKKDKHLCVGERNRLSKAPCKWRKRKAPCLPLTARKTLRYPKQNHHCEVLHCFKMKLGEKDIKMGVRNFLFSSGERVVGERVELDDF